MRVNEAKQADQAALGMRAPTSSPRSTLSPGEPRDRVPKHAARAQGQAECVRQDVVSASATMSVRPRLL
jgi:hypothetical protein